MILLIAHSAGGLVAIYNDEFFLRVSAVSPPINFFYIL